MIPGMPQIPEISIGDAKEKLDEGGTIFVDVRDGDSYNQARIEGALMLSNENIQEFLDNTAKDQPIVVYCYHGNTSKGATDFLMKQGYANVHSMSGGFEAWRLAYNYDSGDDSF